MLPGAPLPEVPAGRQVINAYGGGGFRVADRPLRGSLFVFPDHTLAWTRSDSSDLTIGDLAPVLEAEPKVEILLLGCGRDFVDEPGGLRKALRERGIALEWMATGAACGTFNILLAEERRVAAALIAVD